MLLELDVTRHQVLRGVPKIAGPASKTSPKLYGCGLRDNVLKT